MISHKQFLETRIHNPPYPWLLVSHKRISDEISNSRRRLGMLRYDLLLTFKVVNAIDEKLLEIEYINWLLDERAKCNKAKWMLIKDEIFDDFQLSGEMENEKQQQGTFRNNDGNATVNDTKTGTNDSYYRLKRLKYEKEFKAIIKYCYDVRKQIEGFSDR